MDGDPGGEASSIFDRGVARWMEVAGLWPKSVVAILAALVVLSGLALPRIQIDADTTRLFAADLPAQQRAAALDAAFPELGSTILIVVRAPGADSADLAVSALAERLKAGSPWIEGVLAPSVNPFLVGHGFMFRDTGDVGALFSQLSQSANLIAQLRTDRTVDGFLGTLDAASTLAARGGVGPEALAPLFTEAARVFEAHARGERRIFGWSSLIGGDANATDGAVTRVITVAPRLDTTLLSPARPALDVVADAIAGLPPDLARGVEIGVTGEPALRAEELDSVFGTIGLSAALSLMLVAVLLLLGLRTVGRSVVAMISLLCTLILTAGFAAVAFGTLNQISIAFIVLMVGMGVDYAIHILAHIAETRRGGVPPAEAVVLTGRRTGLALCLSAGSSALAFLSFSTTDFTGMAQLGVIGAGGILIAFLTAATLIPALIAFRPGIAGSVELRREPLPAIRRFHALPWLVLVLGAAALWPAMHAHFEADPMALRDPAAPAVQTFRMLTESPRTTPYRASVLVPSAEAAAEVAVRFADMPGVAGTVTLQDLIPEDQDEKLFMLDIAAPSIEHAVSGPPTELIARPAGSPFDALEARLSGEPGAAGRLAAALAAYGKVRTPAADRALGEDLFRSFPLLISRLQAMLTAGPVTEETLPPALRSRYVSPEGVHRVVVLPETSLDTAAELAAFATTVRAVAPDATGGPVQIEAAASTVSRSVLQATLLAALATALVAWLSTRRIADTVAILLPLAIAGAITAAATVLLAMPFNYANVIVLPLMLGLGVDAGIHVAVRERRAPGAVFATSTPRAVLFSALTTIAAFGTLALSHHRGTASMGVLLSVALLAAVGAVMGLTPAIMRWMSRH